MGLPRSVRIPSGWAKQWFKYSLADVDDLLETSFESVHGSIDTTAVNADPDRQVPVDVVRMMANENLVELQEFLYSTTGNMGSLPEMRRTGAEIARELVNEGVQAVIVGSTRGTGTRSGSTLAKEIDRAGIPSVLVTALVPLAESVGVNRIVQGNAVTNPFGDPDLPFDEGVAYRRSVVETALEAVRQPVDGPTVFEVV